MKKPKKNQLISAEKISLKLSGKTILDNISLTINKGEVVTLIGPNGAGKTTLMKVLLGITKPDGGNINKTQNLVIGYVPQRISINPLMPISVKRFMSLARQVSPLDIKSALEEVGAEHLLNNQMKILSGGELQRVLLAHALLQTPDLLILDEPVQGMDIGGQAKFYEHLEKIRHRLECGVLMSSHDLHMVMATTDDVICMHHHICCAGKPADVSRDPALLEMFGEKAIRSLAVYSHDHDHRHDGHSNRDIEKTKAVK